MVTSTKSFLRGEPARLGVAPDSLSVLHDAGSGAGLDRNRQGRILDLDLGCGPGSAAA